jgi:hypothetical protein
MANILTEKNAMTTKFGGNVHNNIYFTNMATKYALNFFQAKNCALLLLGQLCAEFLDQRNILGRI